MTSFFLQTNEIRPNRLTETKDEDYHVQMGRWALNSFNTYEHQSFIAKTLLNWAFYKGGDRQWSFEEDLSSFFLDDTGDPRNRIRVVKNMISPMVRQFIGNAVRISFNARAETTSDFVVNNRERELNKLKFFFQASKATPDFKNIIQDHVPIKDTEAETVEQFDNMFDDNMAETINNLLRYMEIENDMEEIKIGVTEHYALSGLGIAKGFHQNGEYCAEEVDPMFFIRDITARRRDLTDSEFMGEWYYKDVPSLFERFQNISQDNRMAIEKWSQGNSSQIHNYLNSFYMPVNGKVPVYEIYFRDTEEQEFGYVDDGFGYPLLTRINHPESKYTDKDLIKPPKKSYDDKLFAKGEKKTKVCVDTLRYCIFIPKEEIGTSKDIVLEWGELPYQEKNRMRPSNVAFPYKCYTWVYDKGEIISPIDDAINPQRMTNRLLSVQESHINNARGTGYFIADSAIDGQDGEDGVTRNMNTSKPVRLNVDRVGGVNNAVAPYGSGINQSINNIGTFINEMQMIMNDTTGVNESMMGTQGTSDVLVGVAQANILRGSIVQEKFYYGLTKIMLQLYQNMATTGKRIYRDNPRRACIATGDGGYQILVITDEMANEDFRIKIRRTESDSTLQQEANNLILTLYQFRLLDDYRVSMLYNRATPDMVCKAMREYQMEIKQGQIDQTNANLQRVMNLQRQQQAGAQEIQDQQNRDREFMMEMDQADKDHELEMEELRGNKKIENSVVNNMMSGNVR